MCTVCVCVCICTPIQFPQFVCMTVSSSKCSQPRKQIWHMLLLLSCSVSSFEKKMGLMLFCCLLLHQRGKSQNNKRSGEENVETGEWGDMQAVEEGDSGRRDSLNQYCRSAGIWNGAQGQFKVRHIRLPIVALTWGAGPVIVAQQINGCAFCLYQCVCKRARWFVLYVLSPATQLPETGKENCSDEDKCTDPVWV